MSTAKSACNNGASHVNHRQTPHPRLLHAFAARARVCVFFLYSLTNVPYRCLAVYCISNAANALRYTEFPFRVNPTGERNPCTYLELSLKKKEKKKKRRETSIHPPRLLLHHLCTLLPRATDKSRQIWEKTQK